MTWPTWQQTRARWREAGEEGLRPDTPGWDTGAAPEGGHTGGTNWGGGDRYFRLLKQMLVRILMVKYYFEISLETK